MENYNEDVIIYKPTANAETVQQLITNWINNHPHATIDHVINLPGYDIEGKRRILILYHVNYESVDLGKVVRVE